MVSFEKVQDARENAKTDLQRREDGRIRQDADLREREEGKKSASDELVRTRERAT
jgi:hypothetical protein